MLNLPTIKKIDSSLKSDIQHKIDHKTKPPGSLGKIESLARQLSLIQQDLNPVAHSCELLLFAGDHGIAESGVSAFPPEVTQQMVLNFLAGGAAANVFANQNQVSLKIIDTGVKGQPIESEQLISLRIAAGTENFLHQAAMSSEQLEQALTNGIALANDSKSDFLAFGEMGIGNTSSAAMLVHKVTGYSLSQLVGRGTGLDDIGLANKLSILEDAATRTDVQLAPLHCLKEYAGFEIATMCGAMLGGAASGKCLLIDGYIATSALLLAAKINPEILDYSVFCHASAEPGHQLMLAELKANALLDMDLRLGEGTGALLAWPLIQSACSMMKHMASFEDAGVSEKT